MKSIRFPFRFMSLMTLALVTVVSCQKTDKAPSSPTLNSQTQSAVQSKSIQTALLNATNTALGYGTPSDEEDQASCKVVTYNPSANVYPHRKIVDYGSGCIDNNGVTR